MSLNNILYKIIINKKSFYHINLSTNLKHKKMPTTVKNIVITLAIVMVGLAVHQKFVAPRIAKTIK